jgi:hypothetical protein
MTATRRLAILAADVVGYSRLMGEEEGTGQLTKPASKLACFTCSYLHEILMIENSASPGATARQPAPARIYKPRRGLNDVSALSKARYCRSLSRNKAII